MAVQNWAYPYTIITTIWLKKLWCWKIRMLLKPLCCCTAASQTWVTNHKHVCMSEPDKLSLHLTFCQSVCSSCTSVYLCAFLTVLCVYISRGAVCYEVIVSCRGSSMVKVMQVGSCQMAVHPSLGQGVPVPPVRARGERVKRRGVWGRRVPCCLGPAPGCRASGPG